MKTAKLRHIVTYLDKDVMGYDLIIEKESLFFTVEEVKQALFRKEITCPELSLSPQHRLKRSPYLPERKMEEGEFYHHPCLSHRENLDILQGISWERHYHYEAKEDGTYRGIFFQGEALAPVYARPSLKGVPVTEIQWVFQEYLPHSLEEIMPYLPSAPLETLSLGEEKEGIFLPSLLWICGEKEEIPPKAWEKQGALLQVFLNDKVKTLGSTCFSTCPKLEAVTLPQTLEVIASHAFSYTALREIHLPQGLQSLGASAFAHCQNLQEITLPQGITALEEGVFAHNSQLERVSFPKNLKCIGKNAFTATALEEVILPEGLREIGEGAFAHCPHLKRVYFPSSLEKIGKNAFAKTGIEEITLGEGLSFLGAGAFQDCFRLKSLSLSENTKSVGNDSFSGCHNLKKIIFSPSLTQGEQHCFLGAYAFYHTGVEELVLPKTLIEIEENAFMGCEFLWKVDFPEGLQQIGDGAFAQTALLEVRLPDSIVRMGEDVFQDCPSLRHVAPFG